VTARVLIAAFERWRATGDPFVLATVHETSGSTYSKIGARMLINGAGDFQGMLSGGCLEGDLAARASQVLGSGKPESVTYDLGQNDEELWGLGVGCDGAMSIFLQPLLADNQYEPFTSICRAWTGDAPELAATVLQSSDVRNPVGASLVTEGPNLAFCDLHEELAGQIAASADAALLAGRSHTVAMRTEAGEVSVLWSILRPPPRILVLGGGLDARPVVRMICELGWRVVVQDHRPAYIAAGNFVGAEQVLCVPADQLAAHVNFARVDAVIVMSHHLATDRKYLEILAATRVRYIGLLGPVNRRVRLLREMGELGAAIQDRIHGPAGIDIGAVGPASIALSIVAQVHRMLYR
jgi:xanthine/CO dehydrogenase XdhC/CoxF family maturation factor